MSGRQFDRVSNFEMRKTLNLKIETFIPMKHESRKS